jgi:hypothetical protein
MARERIGLEISFKSNAIVLGERHFFWSESTAAKLKFEQRFGEIYENCTIMRLASWALEVSGSGLPIHYGYGH